MRPRPREAIPLLSAVQNSAYIAPVRRLIDHGADITALSGDCKTALYLAVNKRRTEVVRPLLDSGADPNQRLWFQSDVFGVMALHCATWSGSEEIARLLIEAGADVHAAGEDGITSLHSAVSKDAATSP